jgi:hypothetical protein
LDELEEETYRCLDVGAPSDMDPLAVRRSSSPRDIETSLSEDVLYSVIVSYVMDLFMASFFFCFLLVCCFFSPHKGLLLSKKKKKKRKKKEKSRKKQNEKRKSVLEKRHII